MRTTTLAVLTCALAATVACHANVASPLVGDETVASPLVGDEPRGGHGPSHQGHARDINAYIEAMESPQRAEWQDPERVIAALNLKPGERVADVGAGPGYFTLPLAKAVGPTGKVFAVDIEQKMLDRCRQRAAAEGVQNIEYLLVPEDDPSLPAGRIDTIFIVDTYHHFANRSAYVAKLRRALTNSGRIVIIDFIPKSREERGFGPPKSMQLARSTVDAEMATAGLDAAAVHMFLPEQYFVEYRPKGE